LAHPRRGGDPPRADRADVADRAQRLAGGRKDRGDARAAAGARCGARLPRERHRAEHRRGGLRGRQGGGAGGARLRGVVVAGAGGVTRTYTAVATMWAAGTPLAPAGFAARSDVVADAPGATVTHRIIIRAGREVTTRHRFRAGDRIYRVVTLREPDRRFVEILA